MDKSEVRVEYDRVSCTYKVYCPATIDKCRTIYVISEADMMKWTSDIDKEEYYDPQSGMNHWDLVEHILDKHLLPPRRREAIEHTRRLGLS